MSDTKISPEWCEEQANNWCRVVDATRANLSWAQTHMPHDQEHIARVLDRVRRDEREVQVRLLAARALKAREWAQTQLDRLSRVSIATAERFDDGKESACEAVLAILDGREP